MILGDILWLGETHVMFRNPAAAALIIGVAVASLSTSAGARLVSPGHHKSWGMEGVSLEQYTADSRECARQAAEIDLSGTAPAQALVLASRVYSIHWNPHYSQLSGISQTPRIASPQVQWNRAAAIMQDQLDSCLMQRGYVRFELTDEQYDMLQHLERGSDARRAYLHGLASDPGVLAAQAASES